MAWRATVRKDTFIAGGLGLGADLFCQVVCEKKALREVDGRRAAAISIFTGSYLGIACNKIYSLYPALARAVMASDSFRRIAPASFCKARTTGAISTVADNFVHVPALYLPSYFLAVGTLQGMPVESTVKDMQDSWWATLGSCWCFWVPFMALNFTVVPPTQRVRAVAAANFCWTVSLDYITQSKES